MISYILTNPLKMNRFLLPRLANTFPPSRNMGKKWQKKWKKWKINSALTHFLKGVEILFCFFKFIPLKMKPFILKL